jgi:hypothetical protein
MNPRAYRRDYFGKTLAAVLLGLSLARLASALIAWTTPGGPGAPTKNQFVMWIVAPLWIPVLGLVYLFRDSRQAWTVLGAVNLLLLALYLLVRQLLH